MGKNRAKAVDKFFAQWSVALSQPRLADKSATLQFSPVGVSHCKFGEPGAGRQKCISAVYCVFYARSGARLLKSYFRSRLLSLATRLRIGKYDFKMVKMFQPLPVP